MGTISVTGIAIVYFYHDHRAFPITRGINVPFGHFDLLAQTISVIWQAEERISRFAPELDLRSGG
jgi:hypothetical protein